MHWLPFPKQDYPARESQCLPPGGFCNQSILRAACRCGQTVSAARFPWKTSLPITGAVLDASRTIGNDGCIIEVEMVSFFKIKNTQAGCFMRGRKWSTLPGALLQAPIYQWETFTSRKVRGQIFSWARLTGYSVYQSPQTTLAGGGHGLPAEPFQPYDCSRTSRITLMTPGLYSDRVVSSGQRTRTQSGLPSYLLSAVRVRFEPSAWRWNALSYTSVYVLH